ncbi:MAG: TraY domain-containing protein [Alphaproteobacteria bacterium]|nr:TraY domain-containing protein [Alphaproteobacteria bacterium]
MASHTLKNLPPELHRRLRTSAERNRRSLNQEAQAVLESYLGPPREEVDALLADLRRLRAEHPIRTTNAEIDRLERQGRA